MALMQYRKRLLGDLTLGLLAVVPALTAFYTDMHGITNDLFMRAGAIMALFAAFLEFRTHEIDLRQQQDNLLAVWKSISILTDNMEEPGSSDDDLKHQIAREKIKALQHLEPMSDGYYAYNSWVSRLGEILVVAGTLIWALGDIVIGALQ